MNFLRELLLTFIAILILQSMSGQSINNYINAVTEPTPNAGSLGKYGDVPVSYSTGIPNIQIPIFTILEGPLSVPINLSYHGGGIRVAEIASRYGIGWSLQGGGIISRTIQGIEDEAGLGFLNINQDMSVEVETDEVGGVRECIRIDYPGISEDNPLLAMQNGQVDGEPDIFSFSIPGYSGKFHFDSRDSIVQIPKSDLKIYYDLKDNNSGSPFRLNSFTVVDTKGNRYIFGTDLDGSRSIELTSTNRQFDVASSWYLERILSADGIYSIDYKYQDQIFGYKSLSFNNAVFTTVQVQGFELDEIVSQTATVKFVEGDVRQDLHQKFGSSGVVYSHASDVARELSSIRILQGNEIDSIEYVFGQDYFSDNDDASNEPESYCLRLNSVQKVSASNALFQEPAHEFSYFDSMPDGANLGDSYLPSRLSYAIDHWGFYNGAHLNSNRDYNIPKTTVLTKRPGDNNQGDYITSKGSSIRDSDESFMKLGSIRSIKYPTGGKTIFVFEANDYYREDDVLEFDKIDDVANAGQCSYNHFAGSIELTTSDPGSFYYKFSSGENPSGWCGNSFGGARVEIWKDDVEIGTLPYSNVYTSIQGDGVFNDGEETYTFKVYQSASTVSFELFQATEVTVKNNQTVGGLRIKSITTDVDGNGSSLYTTAYEYSDANIPNRSSGRLFNKPVYGTAVEYVYSDACSPSTQVGSGGNHHQNGKTVYGWAFNNYPIAPLSSFEGRNISYSNVIETLPGDGGKNQFQFFQENPVGLPASPGGGNIDGFPYAPVGARVHEGNTSAKASLDERGNPVSYDISNLYTEPYEESEGTYIKVASYSMGFNRFEIFHRLYRIRTKSHRLSSIESTKDGITTKQNFEYASNKHLAPTATWSLSSTGQTLRNETTYSFDSTDPISTALRERNLLIPVMSIQKVNDTIVDGNKTHFSTQTDGYPRPEYIERFEATQGSSGSFSGNWVRRITFEGYQYGLPHIVSKPGWEPEIYTWSPSGLLLSKRFKEFTTTHEYFGTTSKLRRTTTQDGSYIDYTYDPLTRLSTVSPYSHLGNSLIATSYQYEYGAERNRVTTTLDIFDNSGSGAISALRDQITHEYFDGLGRPIQVVKQEGFRNDNDGQYYDQIIGATEYDDRGRPFRQFNNFSSSSSDGSFTLPINVPYSTTEYSSDPLSRTQKSIAPGFGSVEYTYGKNEEVIVTPTGQPYEVNTLFTMSTTDSDGRITRSYTDLRGRNVLTQQHLREEDRYLSTYIEYDHKSRVNTIFPPESSMETPNLLYRYSYEGSDNPRTKKVPDQPIEYYYYDDRDLLTFTASMGLPNGIEFVSSVYDDYGRVTHTGFTVDKPYNNVAGTSLIGANHMLSMSVYGSGQDAFLADKLTSQSSWEMRGEMPKGTRLTTNYSYDEYGRMDYSYANSLLKNEPKAESYSYIFDAIGNPVQSNHQVSTFDGYVFTQSRSSFDLAGRNISQSHRVTLNDKVGAWQTVGKYAFTEQGQLAKKKIGGSANSPLQTVTYQYHDNGALDKINDPVSPGNALFGMDLDYNDGPSGVNSSNRSNGTISAATMFSANVPTFVQIYNYDGLDRLTAMNQQSTSDNGQDGRYRTSYDYDDRGNIQKLNRWGQQEEDKFGKIDELTYSVPGTSNKITRIVEGGTGKDYAPGFDVSGSGINYQYDVKGNVTFDPSRHLNIKYNYLNLPYEFIKKDGTVISITYSSTGQKLAEKKGGGNKNPVRHYLGDVEYFDDRPVIVHHTEGRVLLDPISEGAAVTKTNDCQDKEVPNVPDYPEESEDGEIKQRYAGEYDGFLPTDKTIYEGKATSTTADIPKTNAIAFTGEEMVKLQAGFSAKKGTTVLAATKRCPTAVTWQYEYSLKDHLGNTRVRFADLNLDGLIQDSEVLSEHHYYAFGMEMEGEWNTGVNAPGGGAEDNRYRYNGMELNEDLGLYDYGARWYDPAIGRFTAIDPMAKAMPSWSPYNYTFNSPINLTDPTGMFPEDPLGGNDDFEDPVKTAKSNSRFGIISSNGGSGESTPNQTPSVPGVNTQGGDPPVSGGDLPTVTVTASPIFFVTKFNRILNIDRFAGWTPMGCNCGLSYGGVYQPTEWGDGLMQVSTDMLNVGMIFAGGGFSSWGGRAMRLFKSVNTTSLIKSRSAINYTDEVARVYMDQSRGALARIGAKNIPNAGWLPAEMRSVQIAHRGPIGGGQPSMINLRISPYSGIRPSPAIQATFEVGPVSGSTFTKGVLGAWTYGRMRSQSPN